MGFVRFVSIDEANNSIEALNGQIIAGALKPIIVKFSDTEDERKFRSLFHSFEFFPRFENINRNYR